MKWDVGQHLIQRTPVDSLSPCLFCIRSGSSMRCAGSKDGSNEGPCGAVFLFPLGEFLGFRVSGVSTFDFPSDLKVGPPL